jgi:non-specific serine/threonine protein kinase
MIDILTADKLDVDALTKITPPNHVQQGREDYEKGRVRVRSVAQQSAQLWVSAANGSPQTVSVWLQGRQVSITCTCRQGYSPVACRHKIAAFIGLRQYLTEHPPKIWKAVLDRAKALPAGRTATTTYGPIVFSLQEQGDTWRVVPYVVSGKAFVPADHADPEVLAQAITAGAVSGAPRPIRNPISRRNYPYAPEEALAAANLVASTNASSYGYNYSYGYGYGRAGAQLLEAVMPFLARCLVYVGIEGDPFQERVRVIGEPGTLEIGLDETPKGLRLEPRLLTQGRSIPLRRNESGVFTPDPLWVLAEDLLVPVPDGDALAAQLIGQPEVIIPTADQDEFLENYLMPLAERIPVRGAMINWEDVDAEPLPRLFLREQGKELLVELRFGYGDYELPYERQLPLESTRRKPGELTLARIKRRPEREEEAFKSLSSYGMKRTSEPGIATLRSGTQVVDFLLRHVPRLAEAGYTIFGEDALKSARVNRNKPSISLNVTSGIDWFDVEAKVSFGELEVALKDIRQAVKRREKYVKLADGSIGELPPEWVDRYRKLLNVAEPNAEGDLRLSTAHVTLLDQLLGEADRAQSDEEFRRRTERLRDFAGIQDTPLPPSFKGELRPYQKFGYDWLHFLNDYGFGGCLADDMGVGKTIQTLAFLESLYHAEPDRKATLVVMPRSLLFNWQREAEKFAPELAIYIHHETGRATDPSVFDQYDLVLTTYGTMLRDIEMLRQYRFAHVILDESQAIKNPLAETSKAARLLQSDRRLALTGTPVENSTSELWSQFAFLNPGLLGNLEYFREEFVNPIERQGNGETAQFLRKMVYPFILRRTKDQVATDLPPRSERVVVADMEPAQRKLYNKTRDYYRALLLGLIEQEGMNDARMKILEGLLRLRQICNHPRLVDQKFKGGSGKFELLLETLDTLRAEGHRALIFSQFVQMLTLIRSELDERGVPYAYLDGQTQNRQAVVDRFQGGDELPFFLISLKAGGVGLNLTAADYVIHVDPWWNPAVEMQATDRTHRIGQDKPVFVYKLVVQDSVEEKILQLQDQKRELVEQLVGAEGGVFKSLTREDVEVLFT